MAGSICPGFLIIRKRQIYMNKPKIKVKNCKTVVIVHGYPEPIYADSPLYSYFSERGYNVISPYLFSSEFKLTQEEVDKYIEGKLAGREPDVIVGVSMGGLLAPALAHDYPKSKLVLVGTGPYVRSNIESINTLLTICKSSLFDFIYKIILSTPTPVYSFIYKLFNHPKMNTSQKKELEEHIVKNWSCLKSIKESEEREVIQFLSGVDNSILLHSLKNKTLIFAADGDSMMPLKLAHKLNHLIKNSRLVINKGTIHYTVFGRDNYKDLNEFLLD